MQAQPEPGSAGPIEAAQERSERTIAAAVVSVAALGVFISSWRSVTVEASQGLRILLFAVVIGLGYALVLLRRRPSSRAEVWARATVEVSCATVIILLDASAGPDFVVSSGTSVLYFLAIGLTSLRLDARLSVYATAMAMAQHLAVYAWFLMDPALQGGRGGVSLARLWQELVFRLAVMGLMGGLGAMVARTLRTETARAAEEQRVRTAFGHYVDRRVVRRVLQGDLRIAPERREVTVLFVDIRDFTRMSESRDAGEVFRLLSGTLDAFSQEVQRQGGIVNKYLGDGLLAIFGAPEDQPDHARRAARAALNIVAEARARAADGRFPGLRVGAGLHTGAVVVGDLGGERREFTAIGDVVNVASRVEASNKELGTSILATRPVVEQVGPGAHTRALPPVRLRGRDAEVELFELLDLETAELSLSALSPELRVSGPQSSWKM